MTVNDNSPDVSGNVRVTIPEVAFPSPEGAGKAADAKVTYEAICAEVKRATGAESALGERIKTLEDAPPAAVEVVAPSPDGEGKAADAKAVYEGLEKKREKTDLTASFKEWGDVECSTSSLDPYIETFRPKFEDGAWTTSVNGAGIWGVISVTGAGGDSADSVMVQLKHGIEGYTESITYHRRSVTTTLATLNDIPEVVAPASDGEGKAADAKAVYEALEGKQDALNDGQMAAVNSGVTEEWKTGKDEEIYALQQGSTCQAGLIDSKIPLYTSVGATEVDGSLYLYPFSCNEVSNTLDAMTIASVVRKSSDGSLSFASGITLDCSLVIDCRGRETAPKITWGKNFHPRTDAETAFACVAGVRNVYWISEYANGEFVVAGWQETEGGGTSNGGNAE